MSYNFKRYTDYMAKHDIDAIVLSNYDVTARILNDYFTDLKLISFGSREYNPLVACDRNGEMISVPYAPNPLSATGNVTPLFEPTVLHMADKLKAKGLEHSTIGLEMLDLPARGLLLLQERLPQATFVDITWVVRQDMSVKTEREIRYIEKAVEITEAAFRHVVANMRDCLSRPQSELILKLFAPEVNRLGGEVEGCNLISRPWDWHVGELDRKGRPRVEPLVTEGGTPINFDLLVGYEAAMCDIAFRAVVGEPDPSFVEFWDISVKVKDALAATVKPGMTCAEAEAACVDAMCRAVGSAWDKDYWAVHSVGLHVHEFPQIGSVYIGHAGEYVFETGQVLSVESCAEEAYLMTDTGLRRIGSMPMKIYQA